MSNFQFKQFTIQQDLCAMKVGTDGVLLGTWATATGNNILDIGSGTGVISLMLAQRNPNGNIDAIDIDENAFQQTIQNINNSRWSDRINGYHSSLQEFTPEKKYDLIVTNPPYFIASTKAPNPSRNAARHTDHLSFNDLIEGVKRLLTPTGIFAIILPTDEAHFFIEQATLNQLQLTRRCNVYPNPSKAVKRILMEFSCFDSAQQPNSTTNQVVQEDTLIIETDQRHVYTKEYIKLTQDFYLKF